MPEYMILCKKKYRAIVELFVDDKTDGAIPASYDTLEEAEEHYSELSSDDKLLFQVVKIETI